MPTTKRPTDLTIRPAAEADVPLVLAFIKDLAAYEKMAHEVEANEADLHQALFGKRRFAEVVLGELEAQPAGFALYYHNFSTFLGKPGIYLEDLFVKPAYRGRGVGRALLAHLAKLTQERGCGRLEWWVLDWNQPARDFYRDLGAAEMEAWKLTRLAGEALDRLAAEAEG